MTGSRARGIAIRTAVLALPVILALASTALVLALAGVDTGIAYREIINGAFGSTSKVADVLVVWCPLLLCASGLLITFAAGQWNIGVEGQIMAGAIAATGIVRWYGYLPSIVLVPLILLGGAIGGALWGGLAGVLKTKGNVHEIFGGLGLNFIMAAIVPFLILGPWKQAEGATLTGTDLFPPAALLPRFTGVRLSPVTLAVTFLAFAVVVLALSRTLWGLKLKAIGKNPRAVRLLGIPADRHVVLAIALCGALAGLAGAIQTAGVYGRLIVAISGGLGYLSLLIVLISGLRARGVPLIAFFFAIVAVGSMKLQLTMRLDSSLGNIIQISVVFFAFFVEGARRRFGGKAKP